MRYTLELTYEEMQKAVRSYLTSTLPHLAEPSDIELTISDSEGRTIKLENVIAVYEFPKGGE